MKRVIINLSLKEDNFVKNNCLTSLINFAYFFVPKIGLFSPEILLKRDNHADMCVKRQTSMETLHPVFLFCLARRASL